MVAINDFPQILVSDLSDKRKINWVAVRLKGTKSNRDGLGAIVTLFAGSSRQTRWVDGKSGYLSQSSIPLYFGLADARPERIEVKWPSGVVQQISEGLKQNSTLEVTEPR